MNKLFSLILIFLPISASFANPVLTGLEILEKIDTYHQYREGFAKASAIKTAGDLAIFYHDYSLVVQNYDADHRLDATDKKFYQEYTDLPENFYVAQYQERYHLIIINKLNEEQCKLLSESIIDKLHGPVINPGSVGNSSQCKRSDNVLAYVDY